MRHRHLLVLTGVWLLASCGGTSVPAGPVETSRESVALAPATLTRVQLTMSAGELEVKGGGTVLLEGEFRYNVPAWKPTVADRTTNGTREIAVTQNGETRGSGNTENAWVIALNDTVPMEVAAHLGAGEARLTLGSLQLRRVDLEIGAGEVNLDLRGQPTTSYSVRVRGGVGEATVRVPATVGISAKAAGGLGAINVTGLEQRDGRWVSPRASDSPVTIDLDITGGVGEITLVVE